MFTAEISVTNRADQKLYGSLFVPEKPISPRTGVVLVPGWRSHKGRHEHRAELLAQLGMTTLAVNLSGHGIEGQGKSEGDVETLSRFNHLSDLKVFYEFMISEMDSQCIGLLGGSYGGYLSSVLAGEQHVQYLSLWDPALYADEGFYEPTAVVDDNPSLFRQSGFTPSTNRALSGISRCEGSVLLMHAENPNQIPAETIRDYELAAQGKKFTSTVIEGSDHGLSDPLADQRMADVLVDWFRTTRLLGL